MSLKDTIMAHVKDAMRAHEEKRLGTLRLLQAAIKSKELQKRAAGSEDVLSDAEIVDVIRGEAKKRRDSIAAFIAGGRKDLAENEEAELAFLAPYLPAQMSEKEVAKVIDTLIPKLKSKEFGPAMKEAMKELGGKAEPGVVAAVLKDRLAK